MPRAERLHQSWLRLEAFYNSNNEAGRSAGYFARYSAWQKAQKIIELIVQEA